VSRLHAELSILEGGRYSLTDCHSSNGTYLLRGGGAKKVRQELVQPGDRLQFGDVVIGVTDILDSLRGQTAPGGQSEPVKTGPLPRSTKLIRCECGMILPQGKQCPGCGLQP
jgi:pSer/pThr/pTyr-binding forkhead associated (FHA) protein